MKILFLTNKAPYPPRDGGSIATMGLINAFADADNQTTVLAMNTKKHHITPFDIPIEIKNKITFHLCEVPAEIKIFNLLKNLFFSKLPYNAERFIDDSFKDKLEKLLISQEFDIIQLEGLYVLPYIPTIRKNSKAKVVYRSHNVEHEIWERTVINSKGIKKAYLKILASRLKQFELNAINKYDLIIPITSRDEQSLNKLGNNKPSLSIPAGFDIESEPEQQNFEQNLFFIGALDWKPNQDGIIWFIDKCMPLILKKKPKTIFKIAGRNASTWIIEKFKISNIEFLGEIDNAKDYISQNGIMIAPLFSGSGMRVKIIEGMLLKKAIITTSIGCEGIGVENEKNILIADSQNKFSNYVLTLLENKQKVIDIGENAYLFAKDKYNNRNLYLKLIAFYKQYL